MDTEPHVCTWTPDPVIAGYRYLGMERSCCGVLRLQGAWCHLPVLHHPAVARFLDAALAAIERGDLALDWSAPVDMERAFRAIPSDVLAGVRAAVAKEQGNG